VIYETVQEWAHCRDAMLEAIAQTNGTHTEDDILAGVMAGRFKLWRRGASGLITEFSAFPQMKQLNAFITGGSLHELLPLQEPVQNYAAANGCGRMTAMVTHGEKGWERALGDGTKRAGVAVYKDL
jgi:hypothetical protein